MSDRFKKIGEIIAAARIEQNKTLKEAAEITKIKESYLEAVESGNPGGLPSEPYFNLFARSYAQFLGIDPTLFDEFEEDDGKSLAAETGGDDYSEDLSRKHAKNFGRSLIILVIVVVLLFSALIIYNQVVVKKDSGETPPDDNNVSLQEDQPEPVTPETKLSTEFNIPYQPYQSPEKLELVVSARQDVWMVVVRDGDTVLNRQLAAGDVRKWEARYRYVLTLGISTAVDLTLNGKKLPPLSDRAQTITGLEINQINFQKYVAGEMTIKSLPQTASTQTASPGKPNIPASSPPQSEANPITRDSTGTGHSGDQNGD